ncbi:MAG: hypothetical protein G01um101429_1159 [Parcubacteria group bacterium Gr01-1014_29]|nr:MAG: hypothetical protein G01um101429_1159 [Parcubacteria group bacterium Gr01-1014_29]
MDEKRQQLGLTHQKKDDSVFKFFKEATEDIASVFAMDLEHRNYTTERVQLICVFTLIDVIANYWYEYLRKNGTQQERFLAWVKKYCLTDSNPEYRGTDFAHLSAENLYAVRSSMVHFLGIAGLGDKYKLTFATNRMSDEFIAKYQKRFQDYGHHVLVVKPKKLHNLILEGTVLMLMEWKKVIDEAQTDEATKWQHIEGIDRIYQKIQLEGAVKVAIPE